MMTKQPACRMVDIVWPRKDQPAFCASLPPNCTFALSNHDLTGPPVFLSLEPSAPYWVLAAYRVCDAWTYQGAQALFSDLLQIWEWHILVIHCSLRGSIQIYSRFSNASSTPS